MELSVSADSPRSLPGAPDAPDPKQSAPGSASASQARRPDERAPRRAHRHRQAAPHREAPPPEPRPKTPAGKRHPHPPECRPAREDDRTKRADRLRPNAPPDRRHQAAVRRQANGGGKAASFVDPIRSYENLNRNPPRRTAPTRHPGPRQARGPTTSQDESRGQPQARTGHRTKQEAGERMKDG